MAIAPRFPFQSMIPLVSKWHVDTDFLDQMTRFEPSVAKKRNKRKRKTINQGLLSK